MLRLQQVLGVVVFMTFLLSCHEAPEGHAAGKNTSNAYPSTRRVDQVDDYHGTKVQDPYRWLEDLDSAETRAWVDAQNELTFALLERLPKRQAIKDRLSALWNHERYGVPFHRGPYYFYTHNTGLQNQDVLFVTDDLEATGRVLLDPNSLSADGTVHLAGMAASRDGKLLAYGLAQAGSDWNQWKVRDVLTGKDLPDQLDWIKFSGASWLPDGSGFFYSRYPQPKEGEALEQANYFNQLYFHRVGTRQSEDALIYERSDHKDWGFGAQVSEDGRYLIIYVTQGTDHRNMLLAKPLDAPEEPTVTLVGTFEAAYDYLGNDGRRFFFWTTKDAPRGKIVTLELLDAGPGAETELVAQSADTIESATMVGDRIFVTTMKDAHHEVHLFDVSGAPMGEVPLEGLGSVWGFDGKRDHKETFFAYSSFSVPPEIYRFDLATQKTSLWRKPALAFEPSQYETRQVFVASADGTKVPVFLTQRRDLPMDGDRPVYLYGYGGFNISLTPWFKVAPLVWMEMGGVYAVACLRGGGEYGEEWHRAGTLSSKQNVFDDFASVARWLVKEGISRPERIGIGGGSNGGLLVGASITQHPELFGAAVAQVGVFDMLRFHKFTIGWAWADDYGTSDDPKQFAALYAYSPLHNVKSQAYPPILLTTGDHDDRVVPSHSFKFAATLQAAQTGPAPVLIRIETRAGHGAGKPIAKVIEEAADRFAFLAYHLGVTTPLAP